jgi:2-Cys peroxiredoxin 5
MVKVGDSIPSIELVEGKPDAKADLSKELGSGLIIGVPAAFSTPNSFSNLAKSSPPHFVASMISP